MTTPSSALTVPAPLALASSRAAYTSSSRLVDTLESRVDEIARATATQVLTSMQAYPVYGGSGMSGELFERARRYVRLVLKVARTGRPPNSQDVEPARQLGRRRANAVPLAALMHGRAIGSRLLCDWIASEVGSDAQELRAALSLTASCLECSRALGIAMTVGYLQDSEGVPTAMSDFEEVGVGSEGSPGSSRVLLIPSMARNAKAESGLARLSPRERELLELVAQGLTNKEIALRLQISLYTTKEHMSRILEKTRLPSRSAVAAVYAATRRSN